MIIFIFIVVVKTCTVPNQVYTLYPTEGEIIQMKMNNLIQGSNLTYICQNCSQQGANVSNIFKSNQIIKVDYTFKSVTFSEDKIYALTTENSLNIYQNINGEMDSNPKIIPIDQSLECFSVSYIEAYNIIIDCYQDQKLILYYLRGSNLREMYSTNSSIPSQTKISSIQKNKTTYIIYGQSFNYFNTSNQFQNILNLTILTQNKRQQLIVKDNLQDQAYNFFVSQRESLNQTIFIQHYSNITSFVLQENGTLLEVESILLYHEIINMAYYYSPFEYYQFDRLFLIVLDDDFDYMYYVVVYYSDSTYLDNLESKQQRNIVSRTSQIFMSQSFIIIFGQHTISIYQNQIFNQILLRKEYVYGNNTLLYFDEQKEILYIFEKKTRIHELQIPVLNFVQKNREGNFSILALGMDYHLQINYCQVQIKYVLVSLSNNNVSFIFEEPQQSYYNLLQYPFEYWVNYVSGPLIKVNPQVSNKELGTFYDNTSYKLNQSLEQDQNYYITKAFTLNMFLECNYKKLNDIFLVAVSRENIDIYLDGNKSSSFQNLYKDIIVTQIEITFSISNQSMIFIVCLSFGQNIIQIYLFNSQLQNICNRTTNTELFKQFQLLSDSVVLLLETNQIQIIDFDLRGQILIDQKILEEKNGQKVDLNLINIFINSQYQSRVLYINNNNSFIIGYITEDFIFELILIQDVTFQIENLQVVNNLLILSWIPQHQEVLYFEVWNVKNLSNPFYLSQMSPINFALDQKSISLYSDNQFFYVLDSSTINVYNPYLHGRSSLYYRFKFDGNYFTSITIDSLAFLCFNQSFYLLSPILIYAFQNKNIHDNFFTQQIFNFSFSSYLNNSNTIQQGNNSVTIINDFLNIGLKNTSANVNQSQSYVVLSRENISLTGQALQFNLDKSDTDSKVTNYIEYSKNQNYIDMYTQIIQYTNSSSTSFLLMNNQSILNYSNNSITYQFSSPQNLCVASNIYNESIYALCQDIQKQYQIISLNFKKLTQNNTIQTTQIMNLSQNTYVNTSWIRIYNNHLYVWNDTIQMYDINLNSSQIGNFICISTQFGFQTIEIPLDSDLIILYIYFKPIHKDQLYHKFAKIDNNSQFHHGDENSIILKSITDQFYSFDTIPMIQHKDKEIILMVSNSNFNLIISFLLVINKQNVTNSQLIYQSIIQTSPPYDRHNFNVSQLPQYDQGLLLFMYSNTLDIVNQTHMITFYNISQNISFNFSNPLLFEGGYNFSLNLTVVTAFSFIAYNHSKGQILFLFNNGSTLELSLNIFSINLTLGESKSKKKKDFNFTAYNIHYSDYAFIILNIEKDHLFENASFYVLFGITIIVLVVSFLVYFTYQKSDFESEDDLENEL